MKKTSPLRAVWHGVLLAALVLGCALQGQAQTIVDVSTPDPGNIVLFQSQPIQNFQSGIGYILNVPLGTNSLVISLSPTAHSDTVQVITGCHADASALDSGFLQWNTSQYTVVSGSGNIPSFGSGVTVNLFSGGFPTMFLFHVTGCSRFSILFQTPTGTLTDTVRAQGVFLNASLTAMLPGGIQGSMALGNNNGSVVPIRIDLASGGTVIAGSPGGGIDGIGNSNIAYLGGSNAPGAVASFLFNGTSWDRQVKCPTAVPITIGAGATFQVVAPVAGQKVRICALVMTESVAGTLQGIEGTGGTCGTGTTNVTGAMTGIIGQPITLAMGPTSVLQTNVSGDGFCLVNGAAVVSAGYAQIEQH